MTLLVPFMLFGWIPFSIILFLFFKPHHAVLIVVVGGTLLLPMTSYDLPGLPDYTKMTAIAFGLVLGGRFSGQRQVFLYKFEVYDLPMIIWCFCPIITSLSNNLGLYDGLANAFSHCVIWGIPYLAGRIYFKDYICLRDFCLAIVIGGILYLPLCLYEIRMSPQLSNIFYGFFPHSFGQHMRYGGFRPIVFMQHGLMVAFWMAITTTVAFWLRKSGEILYVKDIPLSLLVVTLTITTVLCKSANGWFFLVLGFIGYFIYPSKRWLSPFYLLLLLIPLYILFRIMGFISGETIQMIIGYIFDVDRVQSLGVRLRQEDLFIIKALERPVFGWGGYNRGWPVDLETGHKLISMIDSLWLITFSTKGLVGILSLVSGMLIGPWLIFRSLKKQMIDTENLWLFPVVLSYVVILFMIDSLVNGMVNQIYILISGSLVTSYVALCQKSEVDKTSTPNDC